MSLSSVILLIGLSGFAGLVLGGLVTGRCITKIYVAGIMKAVGFIERGEPRRALGVLFPAEYWPNGTPRECEEPRV